MRRFIARCRDKITGVIQGFDRIVFRGWIRPLTYEAGMGSFLRLNGVQQKDFEPFAKALTTMIRDAAHVAAEPLHEKVDYLSSPQVSKETVARNHHLDRQGRLGPICVLSAVEPCSTWEMFRDRERKERQDFRRTSAKCLHHYHYFHDERFGFMHVRIQTWLPFQVRVCINGREWLARRLEERRLRHRRAGNCFPWIASPDLAQELMDDMLQLPWGQVLDEMTLRASPVLGTIIEQLGRSGLYWTVWQSEWATDVMFKDEKTLSECYPAFVRHGIEHLGSPDVMRFLGRKLHGNYAGEITTSYRMRPEGVRVKHVANANGVKMYDKAASILRVETTITRPEEFLVHRKAHGDRDSAAARRPLRKGIVDLPRLVRVAQACNRRYLDSLATVDDETPLQRLVEPLTAPTDLRGRQVRGLRPWADLDFRLLQAVGAGEFLANGFRNRDIRARLFPDSDPNFPDRAERRRNAAKVSRLLRILTAHGLIERVPRSHRYLVTHRGRLVIAALVAARNANVSKLRQCA